MSELPKELKYASSHEWARLESDGTIVVGITDHAQEALGDVVYVELPEVGSTIDAGAEVAVVGSVDGPVDATAVAWRDKSMHGMKDSRRGPLSSCRPCTLYLLDQTPPAQAQRFN